MATDLANATPRSNPRHSYWQLPTFLLGVAAAYCAYTFVPRTGGDPSVRMRAAMSELKTQLERRPLDSRSIDTLLESVATDDSPLGHYTIGSAYLALGESEPTLISERWKKAYEHLRDCDVTQLPASEAKKYAFRFAKASAAVGQGEVGRLISDLMIVPTGEDRTECSRLIAESALRQSPPDNKRARDELALYLGGAHRLGATDAAELKLKLAELNLSLNESEKARVWLKDIGTNASAEVMARSKVQLARLAAAENKWEDALKLFEAATATSGLPPDQMSQIRYQTGFAMMQLNRPDQAIPYFEQAARENGSAASAASVRMAELRIRDPKSKGTRSEAVQWLERAASAPKGTPPLAPNEMRAVFEEVIKTCMAEADYASGLRAAVAYSSVAENGKDREYRAEINSVWATNLQRNPDPSVTAQAREKLISAGKDFADLAEMYPTPAGRAEMLKRAALSYRQAGESTKALTIIQSLLASKGVPDEYMATAWVEKANLLPTADFQGKKQALEQAMLTPTTAAAEARFLMAVLHINHAQYLGGSAATSQNPDAARREAEATAKLGRDLLIQIADAVTVPASERAIHEEAIFELGRFYMSLAQYADAITRFRSQLRLYASGIKSSYARLYLACCLGSVLGADKEAQPTDPRLAESLKLLEPLLNSPDAYLKAHAEIRTLHTILLMGRFEEVAKRGPGLMDQYKGRWELLPIGKLVFHANLWMTPREPGEALKTLLRMENAYKEIPRENYPADPEYSCDQWKLELTQLRQAYNSIKGDS